MKELFNRKNREAEIAPQPEPPRALTTIERLEVIRRNKEAEMQRLNAELIELDTQVAWLSRFPQIERIIALLRKQWT